VLFLTVRFSHRSASSLGALGGSTCACSFRISRHWRGNFGNSGSRPTVVFRPCSSSSPGWLGSRFVRFCSGSHFTCGLIGFDSVIFVTPRLQCSCLGMQPFAWRDGVVLGRPSRMPCSSWTCVASGSACFLQSCGTFVPCFSSPVVRFCPGSHFTYGLIGFDCVKNSTPSSYGHLFLERKWNRAPSVLLESASSGRGPPGTLRPETSISCRVKSPGWLPR